MPMDKETRDEVKKVLIKNLHLGLVRQVRFGACIMVVVGWIMTISALVSFGFLLWCLTEIYSLGQMESYFYLLEQDANDEETEEEKPE